MWLRFRVIKLAKSGNYRIRCYRKYRCFSSGICGVKLILLMVSIGIFRGTLRVLLGDDFVEDISHVRKTWGLLWCLHLIKYLVRKVSHCFFSFTQTETSIASALFFILWHIILRRLFNAKPILEKEWIICRYLPSERTWHKVKARRPIKVGINGRGRSGTSRDSNPADHWPTKCNVGLMSLAVSQIQIWIRARMSGYSLNETTRSSAYHRGQRLQLSHPKVAQPKLEAIRPLICHWSIPHPAWMPDGPAKARE